MQREETLFKILPLKEGSVSYVYFTNLHNTLPFTIRLEKIVARQLTDEFIEYPDTYFFDEVSTKLNNFYSWMSILIKRKLVETTGTWKCSFRRGEKIWATTVINFDTHGDWDGLVYS